MHMIVPTSIQFSTLFEPFRVKTVEPLQLTTPLERKRHLREAGFNLFRLPSESVIIDLLTDSGTGAMSSKQWSAIMRGDESYAGSPSFFRFEKAVKDIMGFDHVLPTHQGRAAERLLFGHFCGPGLVVPNNTHFDTTRANIEEVGGLALDLPCTESQNHGTDFAFKGNMNLDGLLEAFKIHGRDSIPLVMMTITNNAGGGQPASLENIRSVAEICRNNETPFYIDACRFAENAYLIQQREPGCCSLTIREIVKEIFSLAQGCTMSAKKDGMCNIGGFVAVRDDALSSKLKEALTLGEGFPTYGGLAGRDLEAIAVGLHEAMDRSYLAYRIRTISYFAENLNKAGVPILLPPGGHAVFIDAARFAPNLTPLQLPGISISNALYLIAGIRTVEIGSAMFGYRDSETKKEFPAPMELVRLALPRRMYTQSHIDYVVEAVCALHHQREALPPYQFVRQSRFLRHFTAIYQQVGT
jgi:tyrosine phenol-lyase